jgi:molecular chaperone HtpG
MDTASRATFQVHLPGLLTVLAEHLYASRTVAIRELLQNAHDSCVRRAVEHPSADYQPRIDVSIDQRFRLLTISDNGSGLTDDDIRSYLTTIGRSYTRELKDRLGALSPDEAAQLIGQFGFGFLSAFLLASEVTLHTRACAAGSPALCWSCVGDAHYDIVPGERAGAGTTVELRLKPAGAFLLERHALISAIRRYADFLPTPIYVSGDPTPVNYQTPPWESHDPAAASRAYAAQMFPDDDPLCVIPLHDHVLDLGHDRVVVPLRGFLFVPSNSVVSVREYGDLTVYIRRMLITHQERDLLPRWARFVRGVIDCPRLQPTASREAVHQDEDFAAVQIALTQQLAAGLRRIARDEPTTWRTLVRGHASVITGWAVTDDAFFEQVADIVTFRTTRGELSLPEYLSHTDQTLYYVTRELGSVQEQVLAEGQDVPVIDAHWFKIRPFLEKYAARRPNLPVVPLDNQVEQLVRPVAETPYVTLLDAYRAAGVRARMASFQPSAMPAIMLFPRDAEFLREARDALARDELPDALATLMGDYLNRQPQAADELDGTLHLNAASPLIQRLATRHAADLTLQALLTVIHQLARLVAARGLTAQSATSAFANLSDALETVVP